MNDCTDNWGIFDKGQTSTSEELFSFATLEISIGPFWHISEEDMLDTDTLESLDLKTARLNHPSNLSIFSFCQNNQKGIRTHTLYFTRRGLDILGRRVLSFKF
jgi:hypothetical protein